MKKNRDSALERSLRNQGLPSRFSYQKFGRRERAKRAALDHRYGKLPSRAHHRHEAKSVSPMGCVWVDYEVCLNDPRTVATR